MFGNDHLIRPRKSSMLLALAVAIVVFIITKFSSFATYLIALMTLVMIIVVLYTSSIWATRAKQENMIIFATFWGLIIGAIIPFIISVYLEGGISGLTKLFLG